MDQAENNSNTTAEILPFPRRPRPRRFLRLTVEEHAWRELNAAVAELKRVEPRRRD